MITLPEYTAYWAHRRAEEEVIICGDTRYTWREFNRRARSIAAGLQEAGIEVGDRVALLLTSSAEWTTIFAAISIAGGVIVPLNPRFGRFELRGIEEDAHCRVLVTTPSHGAELADHFDLGGGPEHEIVLARRAGEGKPLRFADVIAAQHEPSAAALTPDSLAAIFYTSGTTGVPKGTMHTHASIQAGVLAQVLGLGFHADERTLVMAPLAFTGACLSLLTPMLIVGGCTVIEPVYDPTRMMELIAKERITFITNVPAIWERLPGMPSFASADFSSLRLTMTGGAPVPVSLIEAFRPKGIVIRQSYGATEGGGMLGYPTREFALQQPSSCGSPQVTVRLRVMTADGVECAPGEVGEFWVKGPQVMTGYWGNPEATAAAFVDGWYKTGDLGFVDADGHLTVVDRLKNMIISGGVNIYPAEIERAMASIEAIEEIGVFGQSDEKWGERVVALIYSARPIDVEAVQTEARRLLGAFKTPREIIVSPTPLPRTVTNKISRRDLAALYNELTGSQSPQPHAEAS